MYSTWDTLVMVVLALSIVGGFWMAWRDCFRPLVDDAIAWCAYRSWTRIVQTYNKNVQRWGFQLVDRRGNTMGPWFEDITAVFVILVMVFSILEFMISIAISVAKVARWPLAGLAAYLGLLIGYGFGWAPAYYGFIAVTVAAAAAMVIIAVVDLGQRIASRFEWRDMGYYSVREQIRWTIGFVLAATVVFISTNVPRVSFYAEVPGDLAVAGRIFGGLFLLVAASIFSTPLRLRPLRARI